MRRLFCVTMVCVFAFSMLCVSVGATEAEQMTPLKQETEIGLMATGSFNMSVAPYGKSESSKELPLAAGEKVTISAVYVPEDSSMDFGLVDSGGTFHYFTVTGGNVDKTIRVSESDNYTFAIRNNSGVTVKVSGFISY